MIHFFCDFALFCRLMIFYVLFRLFGICIIIIEKNHSCFIFACIIADYMHMIIRVCKMQKKNLHDLSSIDSRTWHIALKFLFKLLSDWPLFVLSGFLDFFLVKTIFNVQQILSTLALLQFAKITSTLSPLTFNGSSEWWNVIVAKNIIFKK
jgi:hypothetical protein